MSVATLGGNDRFKIPNKYTIGGRTYSSTSLYNTKSGAVKIVSDAALNANDKIKTIMPDSSASLRKGITVGGRDIVGITESRLKKSDDVGTQTTGGVVSAAFTAGKVFKAAQTVSPFVAKTAFNHVPNAIIRTGRNTFDVVSTAGKASVCVSRAINGVGLGSVGIGSPIALNTRWDILKYQAMHVTGLNKTKIATRITNGVKTVQNGVVGVRTGVYTAWGKTRNTLKTSYNVVASTPLVVKTAYNSVVAGARTAYSGAVAGARTAYNGANAAVAGAKTAYNGANAAVAGARTAYNGANAAVAGAKTAYNGANAAVRFSRVVMNGNVSLSNVAFRFSRGALVGSASLSSLAFSKLWATRGFISSNYKLAFRSGGRLLFSGAKGVFSSTVAVSKGSFLFGKFLSRRGITPLNAVNLLGSSLMSVSGEDPYVQGLGGAMKMGVYGTKTSLSVSKYSYRILKSSVKTAVSGTSGAVRGAMFLHKNGFAAAGKALWFNSKLLVQKAGGSVVSAALGAIKALGTKVVAPLILIVVLVAAIFSIISSPIAAFGGIFGGSMSISDDTDDFDDEVDIREFILNPDFGLPYLRHNFVNNIYEQILANHISGGGYFHIIRLFDVLYGTPAAAKFHSDSIHGEIISYDDVDSAVVSLPVLVDIILPIFNSVILMDYDLEPTFEQALDSLIEIFNYLLYVNEESFTEWCGQLLFDGEGEYINCSQCHRVHASFNAPNNCPNSVLVIHGSFVHAPCCEMFCPGHWSSSVGWWRFCMGGCMHRCWGLFVCGSHDVQHVTVSVDGVMELLGIYFYIPIEELLNLAVRTPEQEERLLYLQDMLELALEIILETGFSFGGGITMEALSHVEFVIGTRENRQIIVDTALSWVGQVGGQPFWSFMGFSSRVPWCATFVYRIFHDSGFADFYPTHGVNAGGVNAASTISLVNYFRSIGQWQNSSFRDHAAGDVIFFDWTLNGQPNHVGIVVGRCETYVYYVDGNSSDSVRLQHMRLDSIQILGYAIMW